MKLLTVLTPSSTDLESRHGLNYKIPKAYSRFLYAIRFSSPYDMFNIGLIFKHVVEICRSLRPIASRSPGGATSSREDSLKMPVIASDTANDLPQLAGDHQT